MRKQLKLILSLCVVMLTLSVHAQTKSVYATTDSKLAFKSKPSIEKRIKRTDQRKKFGALPVNHKTPIVIRKNKGK